MPPTAPTSLVSPTGEFVEGASPSHGLSRTVDAATSLVSPTGEFVEASSQRPGREFVRRSLVSPTGEFVEAEHPAEHDRAAIAEVARLSDGRVR